MIELKIQMFGGRGSSSGAGGSGGNSLSVNGLPKTLDEDVYRMYTIRYIEGSKTREQTIYATRWQIRQKEFDFMESHDLTYSQFMRQSKYAFMATQFPGDYSAQKSAKDVFDNKRSLQEYQRSKREFYKRWKQVVGKK